MFIHLIQQPSETETRGISHMRKMRHMEVKKEMGADTTAGEPKEQGRLKVSRDTSIVLVTQLFKGRGLP